jgi:glucosamine-6-phosphate deaminase
LIGKENLGLQGELLSPTASTANSGKIRGHEMLVRQLFKEEYMSDEEEELELDRDDKPRPVKKRRSQ